MNSDILYPADPYYRNSITTSVSEAKPNRKCTDCGCLVAYLLVTLGITGICLWYGPLSYSFHGVPLDTSHQLCKPPYTYLYIPAATSSASVCVSSCPRRVGLLLGCRPNKAFPKCPHSVAGLVRNEVENTCRVIGSKPKSLSYIKVFGKLVLQHQDTILKSSIGAGVLSFIVVVLILLLPQIMSYLCIVLLDVVLIALGGLGLYEYHYSNTIFRAFLPNYFWTPWVLCASSVILLLVGFISLLSVCFKTLRSRQMSYLIIIIRLSRICISNNLYLPLVALISNALSIGVFYLNLYCLKLCLGLVVLDPTNRQPHHQLVSTTPAIVLGILLVVQFVWTHGFLVSLSHWLLQVVTTLWYYNSAGRFYGLSPLFSTLRLTFIHLGTILFGAYYPYYSQNLANFTNNIQKNCNTGLYNCLCCIHNCCCRYLHIYAFIQTALKSLSFWPANIEFYHIRLRMRVNYPALYMLGYFLSRATKNLIVFVSIVGLYLVLLILAPGIFRNIWYMVPPLLIGWFLAVQIVTPWMDLIGLLADTLAINYYMQSQYNSTAGISTELLSCSPKVLSLLKQVDISL